MVGSEDKYGWRRSHIFNDVDNIRMRCMFLRELTPLMDDVYVDNILSSFAQIQHVKVISHGQTSYAFVTFFEEEDMLDDVLELEESRWDDQYIRAEVARERFYKFA
ncbi:unnamed protein product [Brassica napus]|uniref:(rape) hypothetical protein n=1 Tax=Brassica napus TaxID=3708 RepID=A0A816ZHN8_BRANA|nr:unnamed protein product [Brassica napus]